MENPSHSKQDTHKINYNDIEILCQRLRDITDAAKLMPICYSFLLIILTISDAWESYNVALAVSSVLFVSLPFVILCLFLAGSLNFCKWYRVQCLAMLLPLAVPLCRIFCPDIHMAWVRGVAAMGLAIPTAKCIYINYSSKIHKNV